MHYQENIYHMIVLESTEALNFLKRLFYKMNDFDEFTLVPRVDWIRYYEDDKTWQGVYDYKKGNLLAEGEDIKIADVLFELDKEYYGKCNYGEVLITTYTLKGSWFKENGYHFPERRGDVKGILF